MSDPDPIETLREQARELFDEEQYEETVELCNRICSLSSRDEEAKGSFLNK